MLLVEYLLIIFSMFNIKNAYGSDNITGVNQYQNQSTTSENPHFKDHTNRRSVLIINSDSMLRSSSHKLGAVESLLYEEYQDDGSKMNSFMMYNLNDVSNFFKTYLNTEVCHVKCDED